MSGNLANLVVSLEANIARFTADMNRAGLITQATMSGIERAASSAKGALAGITAGLSVGVFASLVQESIATIAALDDMAEKTGSTVERLSSLSEVAKVGGHDINAIGDSIVKLAKSMVQSTDASSAQARALASIGLSATDASGKLKDSGEFMVELAGRLNEFSDGTGKTALALELLGKSGAQVLPFLKDLAEFGELNAKVTKEQAALAEQYEKNLKRLGLAKQELFRTIAVALLPVLNDFVKTLLEVNSKTAGVRDAVRDLAANGSLERWARTGAIAVAVVIDTFSFLKDVVMAVVGSFEVVAADLKVLGTVFKSAFSLEAIKQLPAVIEERNQRLEEANRRWAQVWNGNYRVLEESLRKQFALADEAKKHEWGWSPIKPQVPGGGGGGNDEDRKALERYRQELERLLNTLENRADSVSAEFWKSLDTLKRAFDEGTLSEERYVAAVNELIARTKFAGDLQKQLAAEAAAATKEWHEQDAALQAALRGYKDLDAVVRTMIEGMEFEVQSLTMTNAEREVAIKLRELERAGIEKGTEAYRNAAAAIREMVERKETIQGQIDLWKNIESAAHDAFINILQSGKSAFDRLRDALKNGLMELLYQLTVKRFIVNIAANVTGNGGIGAQIGGGGGMNLNSLLSAGSSIGNYLTGGGVFSSGLGQSLAFSEFGQAIGLSTTFIEAAGTTAEVAMMGLTTLGATIGAVIPVLGAVLAIAAAAGVFDQEPSEVQGRFGISGLSTGFEDNVSLASRFGNVGFLDSGTQYFSGDAARVFDQLIADTLDALATRLSDSQVTSLSSRLQGMDFGAFEGTLTTQDFLQQYGGDILTQVVAAAFDELEPAFASLLRGFDGTADEVAAFANSLLGLYDITAKLPTQIRDGLIGALDDTAAVVANVTALANAYAVVQDAMNSDPVADAQELIRRSTQGTFDAFLEQSDALLDLIDNFDGSTQAANQLAAATQAYYTAQVALLAQLERLKQSVGDLFANTARNIRFTTLDTPGRIDFLASESDALLARLTQSTNPEEIQRLVERLTQNIDTSFGMLDPDEQRRRAQEFLDYLDQANQIAQQRIQQLETEAQQRAADAETRQRNMLDDFIGKLDKSGDKSMEAALTLLLAARSFPRTVGATVARNELGV